MRILRGEYEEIYDDGVELEVRINRITSSIKTYFKDFIFNHQTSPFYNTTITKREKKWTLQIYQLSVPHPVDPQFNSEPFFDGFIEYFIL